MSVAIGNILVLEESNPLGNQIVVGVADHFAPRKFSNRQFAPHANPSFNVRRFPHVNDEIIEF
jgi:hypothetical protein